MSKDYYIINNQIDKIMNILLHKNNYEINK